VNVLKLDITTINF
jgi:uncharacterized protein YpiB (UPF0302 family)